MSVNTFGVSNQMFQVLPNRFLYEWKRAAVEGVLCPDGLVITGDQNLHVSFPVLCTDLKNVG